MKRKILVIAAALSVCVCALIGCRAKAAFDAGETLSAQELEALKASLREEKKESENDENAENQQQSSPDDSLEENKTVVYYTENGKVYHSDRDCAYLKKSGNVMEGSVTQAIELGKERLCSACFRTDKVPENTVDGGIDQNGDQSDQTDENKTIVYYTKTGEIYHFDRNCAYLKNSNAVSEGTVEDALGVGKNRPCLRCGD